MEIYKNLTFQNFKEIDFVTLEPKVKKTKSGLKNVRRRKDEKRKFFESLFGIEVSYWNRSFLLLP